MLTDEAHEVDKIYSSKIGKKKKTTPNQYLKYIINYL